MSQPGDGLQLRIKLDRLQGLEDRYRFRKDFCKQRIVGQTRFERFAIKGRIIEQVEHSLHLHLRIVGFGV